MLNELRRARGDQFRLVLRLRLDLRIHTVAEADGEWDPEGDQGQQQQVRNCERESGAEAYETVSGSIRRKPTPRTVSMKRGFALSSPSF